MEGKDEIIQPPFMVLNNMDRNYPMCGIPDDLPDVSYRTGPNDWVSHRVRIESANNNLSLPPLSYGRPHVLFMDKCSIHGLTSGIQEVLSRKHTDIRFLPENSNHLLQPADSFVIHKIKTAWYDRWEKHKLE